MADTAFRLTDIQVEEVSMVDRAANQRRFLVVKSSASTRLGAEIVSGADGALTISKAPGDAVPASGEPPATEPPAPNPEPATEPPAGDAGAMLPPTMRIALDVKDEIVRRLEAVAAKFDEVRAMLEAAEVVEGVVEMPPEILGALNAALDVLETGGPDGAVAKGLKQFSRTRTANLRTAYDALGAILGEIESAPPAATDDATGVDTSAVDAFADVAKTVDVKGLEATIAKGFEKLVAIVAKQRDAIEKNASRLAEFEASRTVATSNASETVETSVAKSTMPDGEAWPMDMNRARA
jgi:hypothetical protein